jgi:predicted ABC-type ATPase
VPELYIITGSNGAGKSTVGHTYLPENIQNKYEIFDGDKLFEEKRKQLLKDNKITFKEARNLANDWLVEHFQNLVNSAIATNDNFVYEGHFTEDKSWNVIKRFREAGYLTNMIFFGLKDQDLSQMRVIERAQSGGHYVQPSEIDRNFEGNLIQLDNYFNLLDNITVVDTSLVEHRVLVIISPEGIKQGVLPNQLPEWFTKYLPQITRKVFHSR